MLKEQIKLRQSDADALAAQVASFLAAGGAIEVAPTITVPIARDGSLEQDFMEVLKSRQIKRSAERVKALRRCGLSDAQIIKKMNLSINKQRFNQLWG